MQFIEGSLLHQNFLLYTFGDDELVVYHQCLFFCQWEKQVLCIARLGIDIKVFTHCGQWLFDLFYKVLIERYLWEILSKLQVDREIKKSFRVELGIDSFSDTCCSFVFMLWWWQELDILLYQNPAACIGTYLNST